MGLALANFPHNFVSFKPHNLTQFCDYSGWGKLPPLKLTANLKIAKLFKKRNASTLLFPTLVEKVEPASAYYF